MRTTLQLICFTILSISLVFAPISAQYQFDNTFISVESEMEVNYSTFQGKPILIDLFATWCEPCKVEILHIKEVYEEVGDEVEVLSISIDPSTDSLSKIRDFRDQFEADWLFGLDQSQVLGENYNLVNLPYLLLLDQNGSLVKEWQGITEVSKIYAELENSFDIEIENPPESSSDLTILVERLLGNTAFQITAGLSILAIGVILVSNIVNKDLPEKGKIDADINRE